MFSQQIYQPNNLTLPINALFADYNKLFDSSSDSIFHKRFNIQYNHHLIFNNGHPNIDNNAELFSPSDFSRLMSVRFTFNSKWFIIELEPYQILNKGLSAMMVKNDDLGTFQMNNNYLVNEAAKEIDFGFKQSQIIFHYRGIGIGYGRLSHWWGPGFHSSIALSTNAPSQETYTIGTFNDLQFGKISLGGQVIAMPYINSNEKQLYFSGLKAHFSYHSNPILSIGFHRTFLSGQDNSFSEKTNINKEWTIEDAAKLVIEPLFGQSKRGLDYTIEGTPGFDPWDQLLTGFVKLSFPDLLLDLYVDIASDDNRGNFIDLRAHWDHTLAYLLGLKKFTQSKDYIYFTGIEYLTTRVSNTLKPDFYRGDPNQNSFYTYPIYDYFTYKGRRMGAHSGSSSDDLIFKFGIGKKERLALVSYNIERHGIKSMKFPEIKTELSMTYHQNISNNQSFFITYEYEKIKNSIFTNNNVSISRFLWMGYSISLY